MPLSQAWEEYEKSPDQATPDTVSEALAYESLIFQHRYRQYIDSIRSSVCRV